MLVGSPANPTGTMMSREALAGLIAAAEDAGIRFISDEIYHGLDYAFPAVTAAELSPHALVINSFSKYFCMTGWRVGWMVVPEILVRPIERLQQNLSISVPTLSQIAAEAAFDGAAEMEEIKHGYQENRRILIEGLPKAGLDQVPAGRRRILSLCRRLGLHLRQLRVRQADAGAGPCCGHAGGRFRSDPWPFIHPASLMRVRLRRCGRQLTGSLTGLNSRQFRTAFWSATCLTVSVQSAATSHSPLAAVDVADPTG